MPIDSEVIKFYQAFTSHKYNPDYQWEAWQWLYGMLATYGLRVHELWAIDLEKFLDPFNTENIITLDESKTEGLKTGEREVFPYHPEWVELFDLKNVKMPEVSGKINEKTIRVCHRFKKSGIPFTPHTLRHAYAVRGYRLGIPAKEMADSMGHDITTHTRTYQKYMTLDDRKEIVKKALAKGKAEKEHGTNSSMCRTSSIFAKSSRYRGRTVSLTELLLNSRSSGFSLAAAATRSRRLSSIETLL